MKRSGSTDRRGTWFALLSGVVLGVAFLPAPLGFLAWFAFLPLLIALEARVRAGAGLRSLFALGYVFGLAFYLIGIHWIALLSAVAITVPWLKYPAWIVAAAYLALFGGLATLLAGVLARRVPLALTFPCAFLVVEELRASGEMGFPWFQPGYTQHDYPRLIQLASLGSVSLVTLWVLLLNVLIWRALVGNSRMRSALGALLMLALPWVWGQRVLDAAPKGHGPIVSLVQGNIAGEIKWSGDHQREILQTFLDLSQRAAGTEPRPALIVWPETATGSYLRKQIDQSIALSSFVTRTRVPVFSGFADYGARADGQMHQYNAAGLFLPDGVAVPVYAKRHLVPFGERMPFERWAPALGRIQFGQAEWTPGDSAVHFPSETGPFTCLICFESIFPDLARDDVRSGARWLVNITNDEWFGNSAALYQHAAMASFRAVENHVPLARCANTGLTLMIDSYGRVQARAPVFREAVLAAALPAPGPPTLYGKLGDWPATLALIALVVMALLGARAALTARAAGG